MDGEGEEWGCLGMDDLGWVRGGGTRGGKQKKGHGGLNWGVR